MEKEENEMEKLFNREKKNSRKKAKEKKKKTRREKNVNLGSGRKRQVAFEQSSAFEVIERGRKRNY